MVSGGVVSRRLQIFDQMLGIGHLAQVHFFQQLELQHGSDHIITGLDHVVTCAAGLNLGQEFFIVGEYVIINLAVIFLFEICKNLGVKIVSPAKQIQNLFPVCGLCGFRLLLGLRRLFRLLFRTAAGSQHKY